MNEAEQKILDEIKKPEKIDDYIKELEAKIDDLEFQNKELVKVIQGKFEKPEDNPYANDPEFAEMEAKLEASEKIHDMYNMYHNYIAANFMTINWMKNLNRIHKEIRQLPLHIPTVKENMRPSGLCTDENYLDVLNGYTHQNQFAHLRKGYTVFSNWAYNKSEPYSIDHYNEDEETCMHENKILHAIACWVEITKNLSVPFHRAEYEFKSGVMIVNYADFWLWCRENPGACVWAFRYNTMNESSSPEFYYSLEDDSDVYHMLSSDTGDMAKIIRNPYENPNMELLVIPSNKWRNITNEQVDAAMEHANSTLQDIYKKLLDK